MEKGGKNMELNKVFNVIIASAYAGIAFMLMIFIYLSRPRSFEEQMYVKRKVKRTKK